MRHKLTQRSPLKNKKLTVNSTITTQGKSTNILF